MQPTFENNDRVIALRHAKIKQGDIVIVDALMSLELFILKELLDWRYHCK